MSGTRENIKEKQINGSKLTIFRATKLPTAVEMQELTDAPGGGHMVALKDPEGFAINLFCGQTPATPGAYQQKLEVNYETEKPRVRKFQRFQPGPAAVHKVSHSFLFHFIFFVI